jgi:hypothetical protein
MENNPPMDVLPEESSGEMSIELRSSREEFYNKGTAPLYMVPGRKESGTYKPQHKKHLSLTEDDYMSMTGPERVPPLPHRHQLGTSHYSSSLPPDTLTEQDPVTTPQSLASPIDSQSSSLFSPSGASHLMSPSVTTTPVLGLPDPCEYLAMDMLSVRPVEIATPVKSSSSLTLVPSPDTITTTTTSILSATSTPITPTSAQPINSGSSSFAKTPPVTIRSNECDGVERQRVPSGDSGYVFMSPDVAVNPDQFKDLVDEPSSRLALEERMGGGRRGFGSPRHSSPATRRPPSHTGSKRNSSCLDDNEWIGCEWRLVEDVCDDHLEEEDPPGDEVYMSVYYPRNAHTTTPTTGTRVSPASSSSLVSGTPDSSRFGDLHLDKVVSRLRDDDDDKLIRRPPRGDTGNKRLSPKYIEIPGGNSKTSSRSNLSPFGRSSPPASSPSVSRISDVICICL